MGEDSLNAFMHHLAKSYSMEILLSLIEFVQYQQWLKGILTVNVAIHSEEALIEFPSTVPVSEIIEIDEIVLVENAMTPEMVQMKKAKVKAHRLYQKYVAQDAAEYEINISYSEIRRLNNLLGDLKLLLAMEMDADTLYGLFINSQKAMITYLHSHFSRFEFSRNIQKSMIMEHLGVESASPVPPLESGSWTFDSNL